MVYFHYPIHYPRQLMYTCYYLYDTLHMQYTEFWWILMFMECSS